MGRHRMTHNSAARTGFSSQCSTALLTRGMTYQALGNVLVSPPLGPIQESGLRSLLAAAADKLELLRPHLGQRLVALSERATRPSRAAWLQLWRDRHPRIQLCCSATTWDARRPTCERLGIGGRGDRVQDLEILARLDREGAAAVKGGNEKRAAALLDLEARFIRDHACECLDDFSDELRLSGDPYFEQVGWLLAALLEDHMAELGYEGLQH